MPSFAGFGRLDETGALYLILRAGIVGHDHAGREVDADTLSGVRC
jgi:hypothetical protein